MADLFGSQLIVDKLAMEGGRPSIEGTTMPYTGQLYERFRPGLFILAVLCA